MLLSAKFVELQYMAFKEDYVARSLNDMRMYFSSCDLVE